jgi:Domain of unknown function, B. Theta Gene description (DUF3871)
MQDILELEPVITSSEVVTGPATSSDSNFIQANTEVISEKDLKSKCIIPVFNKDNESTISHPEFLEAVIFAAQSYFKRESFLLPAVRVSHSVKGRVPGAIGKPVDQLREDEKTIYFERMAFITEIPSIRDTVNGNDLSLTIGGVRSYNFDNLNGKKTEEHFKVFIGFKNKVCCNLCIWTDGFRAEIKARSVTEIVQEAYSLFASYRPEVQLQAMTGFGDYYLTERQFAQMVGRSRLFQFLPAKLKKEIHEPIPLMDSQISAVARDYYSDKSFCKDSDGNINLWKLYNLFTGANKSSYIDTLLDRGVGASSFVTGVQNALQEGSHHWFLS